MVRGDGRTSSRTYLAERYQPPLITRRLSELSDLSSRICVQMSAEGAPVRYLSSIYVPADETRFFLFESVSRTALEEASLRAGLSFERIVEAVLWLPAEARARPSSVSELGGRGTST